MGRPQQSTWLDAFDVWGERVFRGKFAQQFAALFYKNGELLLHGWCSLMMMMSASGSGAVAAQEHCSRCTVHDWVLHAFGSDGSSATVAVQDAGSTGGLTPHPTSTAVQWRA